MLHNFSASLKVILGDLYHKLKPILYMPFSIIPMKKVKRCFKTVPESLITQGMPKMANMVLNGQAWPARVEAKDTRPMAGRPRDQSLTWTKLLMDNAIFERDGDIDSISACQWVTPKEIENALQHERRKLEKEMKRLLNLNPTGKIAVEVVPTAVITATLEGLRLGNNDDVEVISDTDSTESDEEPLCLIEAPRQMDYAMPTRLIPEKQPMIPHKFQRAPTPSTSAETAEKSMDKSWDDILESIRNIVTTEVDKVRRNRSSSREALMMSPIRSMPPSPLTHSEPARHASPTNVHINITPTKSSSSKRRKY